MNNFKVFIRENPQTNKNSIMKIRDDKVIIRHKNITKTFNLNRVYQGNVSQARVYEEIKDGIMGACLTGVNYSLFMYGQTSSGKTYTLLGEKDQPGIVFRFLDDMADNSNGGVSFKYSFFEIYNEKIYDLMD